MEGLIIKIFILVNPIEKTQGSHIFIKGAIFLVSVLLTFIIKVSYSSENSALK